jgi:AhpD family alkylhydroperoxidase
MRTTLVLLAAVAVCAVPVPGLAQEATAADAYADMERTLGSVPSLFRAFPEIGVAGAWQEFKSVQLNPNSALDGKTKELLGLAVSAQIPCSYCIYFHTAAARAHGATDAEIGEAVAMAAIVRHWSTVLNGMQVDLDDFKEETDALLARAADSADATAQ